MTTRLNLRTPRLRRHYLGGVAGNALVLGLLVAGFGLKAPAAQAQTAASVAPARIAFDIPAQDLNGAILSFAQKAGVRVFFDTSKFGGRRSAAVVGTLSAPEARATASSSMRSTWRAAATARWAMSPPAAPPAPRPTRR